MRKLKTTDVFAAMRIVREAHVKDEIKRIALEVNQSKKDMNVREIGAELVLSIVEGLANAGAEKEFYKFLSGPMEVEPEVIAEWSITELIENLKELGKMESPEGWASFFKSLGALIK